MRKVEGGSQRAKDERQNAESSRQNAQTKVEVQEGFTGGKHVPDGLCGAVGPQKKECLFLTNKATILLKTKDRVYEQSQTKPIKSSYREIK